jgi:hypothetical protein
VARLARSHSRADANRRSSLQEASARRCPLDAVLVRCPT